MCTCFSRECWLCARRTTDHDFGRGGGPFQATGGFFTAVLRLYLGKSRLGGCRKSTKSHLSVSASEAYTKGAKVKQCEREMLAPQVTEQLPGNSGCKAKAKIDLGREEQDEAATHLLSAFMHWAFAHILASSPQCSQHFFLHLSFLLVRNGTDTSSHWVKRCQNRSSTQRYVVSLAEVKDPVLQKTCWKTRSGSCNGVKCWKISKANAKERTINKDSCVTKECEDGVEKQSKWKQVCTASGLSGAASSRL